MISNSGLCASLEVPFPYFRNESSYRGARNLPQFVTPRESVHTPVAAYLRRNLELTERKSVLVLRIEFEAMRVILNYLKSMIYAMADYESGVG